jgi:hypothetical protein
MVRVTGCGGGGTGGRGNYEKVSTDLGDYHVCRRMRMTADNFIGLDLMDCRAAMF